MRPANCVSPRPRSTAILPRTVRGQSLKSMSIKMSSMYSLKCRVQCAKIILKRRYREGNENEVELSPLKSITSAGDRVDRTPSYLATIRILNTSKTNGCLSINIKNCMMCNVHRVTKIKSVCDLKEIFTGTAPTYGRPKGSVNAGLRNRGPAVGHGVADYAELDLVTRTREQLEWHSTGIHKGGPAHALTTRPVRADRTTPTKGIAISCVYEIESNCVTSSPVELGWNLLTEIDLILVLSPSDGPLLLSIGTRPRSAFGVWAPVTRSHVEIQTGKPP